MARAWLFIGGVLVLMVAVYMIVDGLRSRSGLPEDSRWLLLSGMAMIVLGLFVFDRSSAGLPVTLTPFSFPASLAAAEPTLVTAEAVIVTGRLVGTGTIAVTAGHLLVRAELGPGTGRLFLNLLLSPLLAHILFVNASALRTVEEAIPLSYLPSSSELVVSKPGQFWMRFRLPRASGVDRPTELYIRRDDGLRVREAIANARGEPVVSAPVAYHSPW